MTKVYEAKEISSDVKIVVLHCCGQLKTAVKHAGKLAGAVVIHEPETHYTFERWLVAQAHWMA